MCGSPRCALTDLVASQQCRDAAATSAALAEFDAAARREERVVIDVACALERPKHGAGDASGLQVRPRWCFLRHNGCDGYAHYR